MATSLSKWGIDDEMNSRNISDEEFEFVESEELKLDESKEEINLKDEETEKEDASKNDFFQEEWTFIDDEFAVPDAMDSIELSTDFSLYEDAVENFAEEMNWKKDLKDQLSWRREEVRLEKEPRSKYFSGFFKPAPYFERWDYYEEPTSIVSIADNKILSVVDNFDFYPQITQKRKFFTKSSTKCRKRNRRRHY